MTDEEYEIKHPYHLWLCSLTLQQTRALASQVGIPGWHSRSDESLYEPLYENEQAYSKYKEIYGEAASIS